jgi:hypothetical protein
MPTIKTLGNMRPSIWESKFCYYSGGNKFLEIFVSARPPPNQ